MSYVGGGAYNRGKEMTGQLVENNDNSSKPEAVDKKISTSSRLQAMCQFTTSPQGGQFGTIPGHFYTVCRRKYDFTLFTFFFQMILFGSLI